MQDLRYKAPSLPKLRKYISIINYKEPFGEETQGGVPPVWLARRARVKYLCRQNLTFARLFVSIAKSGVMLARLMATGLL